MAQRHAARGLWAFATATLATIAVLVPAQLSAREPTKFALLVGVDDYNELTDLSCAGNDERGFAQVLRELGFPAGQIVLLDDNAAENRYRPFRENIVRQFQLLLGMLSAKDLLIVGFSGHGVTINGKSYLCPAGARVEEPGTLIAVDWIYEQLEKCPATLKLLFIDACRRNVLPPGRRGAVERGLDVLELEPPPKGVLILNSCGENQYAREDREGLRHGVFMHFVLEGLRGKADNGRGLVTLYSLCDYVSLETEKYVREKWNDSQRPAIKGHTEGTLDICRLKRAAPSPGDVIKNSIGMKLVLIPAGEFIMGSPEGEERREKDEGPQHRVRITKPFYLGQYEVTLGQFLKFHDTSGYKTDAEKDGGGIGYPGQGRYPLERRADFVPWHWGFEGQTNEHPVVNVSWNDAAAFCGWLCQTDGKAYRLPTEAEWEYACRARTLTRYTNGGRDENLHQIANYADRSVKRLFTWEHARLSFDERYSDGFPFTAPAGSFPPNAFGLYDMHGNASEWCDDRYEKDYYSKSPSDDPQGPRSGLLRVYRGGAGRHPAALPVGGTF